jgi:folylpolyglutamate synthase
LISKAFYIFTQYEPSIDVIVLEVGMGGRYDATNVVDLDVWQEYACGVTLLDYDHTRVLGNTLEKIAWEKGGIFLQHKVVEQSNTNSESPSDPLLPAAICCSAAEKNTSSRCRFFALAPKQESVTNVLRQCSEGYELHLLKDRRLPSDCAIGLAGSHQKDNAELAVALCESVMGSTTSETVHQALAQASWPGRCQTLQIDARTSLHLDGAHTMESLRAGLNWYLSVTTEGVRRTLLFNCSHERNPVELLELLVPVQFHSVFFCFSDSERPSAVRKKSAAEFLEDSSRTGALEDSGGTWQDTLCAIWKNLEEEMKVHSAMTETNIDVKTAVGRMSKDTIPDDVKHDCFVTGSLYLVGSALAAVDWHEPGAEGRLRHERA